MAVTVTVKCKDHKDLTKAIQDLREFVRYVDWTTNTLVLEGPGTGDSKQDAEVAFVEAGA